MSRRILLAVTAAAVVAIGAPPAGAAVNYREHYEFTEVIPDNVCGYSLEFASTWTGSMIIRETKSGEAFLGKDTYRLRTVVTNLDNDKWFLITGHGTFKELSATHVEDDIYEFEAIDVGQPFEIRDADENLIARDRGRIRYTFLFDTFGDGQPGGEFASEPVFDLAGPHPSFDEDFPFCEIVDELVGD